MKYKKPKCSFCQMKSKLNQYFPSSKKEQRDIFLAGTCKQCKDILIVYKWHNEPNDEEIQHMINWATSTFPYRFVDLERRNHLDHFHFHMRLGEGVIDLKKKKSYFQCSICQKFFESKKIKKNPDSSFYICPSCYQKNSKELCEEENEWWGEGEEELTEIQFDDEDAEELGYGNIEEERE